MRLSLEFRQTSTHHSIQLSQVVTGTGEASRLDESESISLGGCVKYLCVWMGLCFHCGLHTLYEGRCKYSRDPGIKMPTSGPLKSTSCPADLGTRSARSHGEKKAVHPGHTIAIPDGDSYGAITMFQLLPASFYMRLRSS